jgi:hypothetical protein
MAMGRSLVGSIGKRLSSTEKSLKFLQGGSKKAIAIGQRAEQMVPKTGSVGTYASRLESTAVALRQEQVGRRAIAGGSLGAASLTMGMSDRKKSGIGSYRPPMPMTRGPVGSGRFA